MLFMRLALNSATPLQQWGQQVVNFLTQPPQGPCRHPLPHLEACRAEAWRSSMTCKK